MVQVASGSGMVTQRPYGQESRSYKRASGGPDEPLSLRSLLRMMRRNLLLIGSILIISVSTGILYAHNAKPLFRAAARILIDPGQLNLLPNQPTTEGARDNLTVDSEIDVIRSRDLLKRVAKNTGVYDDSTYLEPGSLGKLKLWISEKLGNSPPPVNEESAREAALTAFKAQVDVARVGSTFVIQISSSARNPGRAAELTNAIAHEYLQFGLEVQQDKARHSSEWLRNNLDQLKSEVIRAEAAVTSFKLENNMIAGANGLIEDQQLAELNSKVGQAQAAAVQASARYSKIRLIATAGNPDAAVGDILNSSTVIQLRKDYADLNLKRAETEKRFGLDHPASEKLRTEIDLILHLLRQEIGRIADSAKSEYEIAVTHQASMEREFESLRQAAMHTSEKQNRLRELNRQADSVRDLYQHMLARLQETTQGATLPTPRARVIEGASTPFSPVWPDTRLILVISCVLGSALAFGGVIVKELLDNRIRNEDAIEQVTGSICLGSVPRLKVEQLKPHGRGHAGSSSSDRIPIGEQSRSIRSDFMEQLHKLLGNRQSDLAQVLRTVWLNLHINNGRVDREGCCLVFSSAFPGEGKSTIAALQAVFIASTGARTLLIDADTANPTLTRLLAPEAQCGLLDAVFDQSSYEARSDGMVHSTLPSVEHIEWIDARTGLGFIPYCRLNDNGFHHEVLASPNLGALLTRFREDYDYVLIDLPPILTLPDARAVASYIDDIVFVAEWGHTDRDAVEDALRRSPEIAERLSGCLLNKVSKRQLRNYSLYASYRGSGARYGSQKQTI